MGRSVWGGGGGGGGFIEVRGGGVVGVGPIRYCNVKTCSN